jgi:hypothetical protein
MAMSPKARSQPSTVLLLRTPEGSEVRVHVFPADRRLSRDVAQGWGRLAADRAEDEAFRRDLETALRAWYPLIAIHRQEGLGSIREDEAVWYVFRDGSVGNQRPWRNEMHGALAQARETEASIKATLARSMRTLEVARQPRPSPARRAAAGAAASGTSANGSGTATRGPDHRERTSS